MPERPPSPHRRTDLRAGLNGTSASGAPGNLHRSAPLQLRRHHPEGGADTQDCDGPDLPVRRHPHVLLKGPAVARISLRKIASRRLTAGAVVSVAAAGSAVIGVAGQAHAATVETLINNSFASRSALNLAA
jgi:hypothetical protein